jgi:hypothetical protein
MEKREKDTFEAEFDARTLDDSELSLVAGGLPPREGCTCGTRSVCHSDGTDDSC